MGSSTSLVSSLLLESSMIIVSPMRICSVGSNGAVAMLVELDLTCTRISHAGLRHLTGLPNLRRLSCYRCTQIGDDATPILAQMKQLRALDKGLTAITPAA